METRIYLEGGGESKELKVRCREGFSQLLINAGFTGRMPRPVACGGRDSAFDLFATGFKNENHQSLLLVDSEDPIKNGSDEPDDDFAWRHLKTRDNWHRPDGAKNHQALLMATCMETWIAADRASLEDFYGKKVINLKPLPSLVNLENAHRHEVLKALVNATAKSLKSYKKGNRSFELLGQLNPAVLEIHCLQFRRFKKVLEKIL